MVSEKKMNVRYDIGSIEPAWERDSEAAERYEYESEKKDSNQSSAS